MMLCVDHPNILSKMRRKKINRLNLVDKIGRRHFLTRFKSNDKKMCKK